LSIIKGSSRKGDSIKGSNDNDITATNKVRRINPIDVGHPEEDDDF